MAKTSFGGQNQPPSQANRGRRVGDDLASRRAQKARARQSSVQTPGMGYSKVARLRAQKRFDELAAGLLLTLLFCSAIAGIAWYVCWMTFNLVIAINQRGLGDVISGLFN